MIDNIPYKTFCWSIGTTSFRTKDFNKTIEVQLRLLNDFWSLSENQNSSWTANSQVQSRYYDYMQNMGFIQGNATNKSKDAREKTSGLVDIGLIDDNRHLTSAGKSLLEICNKNIFSTKNLLQIPQDSYLYLKQLLKTYNRIDSNVVRPFIVLLYVLSQLNELSIDEFTYLLPLCINPASTKSVIKGIKDIRKGKLTLDDIIINHLFNMNNYKSALDLFKKNKVTVNLLCEVGLNRKSRIYDKPYFSLYKSLYSYYIESNSKSLYKAYIATKDIKIGKWWRNYIFNTTNENTIRNSPENYKNTTIFDYVKNEIEFKIAFFKIMHLFKAKATLADYFDLNRRYIKTTDIILFDDNIVKLDIVPKHFFNNIIDDLYTHAYTKSSQLVEDCDITEINSCLNIKEQDIIDSVSLEMGRSVTSINEARNLLEDNRYKRLKHLIDTKFTDENLLKLLDYFEKRNDLEIRSMVTDNADVPTIFEYVLAILWYKISEYEGKILDFMKLSLDADLLPKTHASGGEADIVYEYKKREEYPTHNLLLEATLADKSNQRRMEMEPVSRHLGQHLLKTKNLNSYCLFITNDLNINVVADFRSRRTTPYYDSQDYSKKIKGMKIIPLEISELKKILKENYKYKDLYSIFETAFNSKLSPNLWYNSCLKSRIK